MPHCSRRLILFLFILYPAITFSQSTLPSNQSDTISYIIQETSIQEELNRAIGELESQFSQNPFGLPAAKNEQLMDLFSEHFAPQKMLSPIRNTFQEQYNSDHAETTAESLSQPIVQQVLAYEKEFYSLQGIRKRVVNRHELEQNPPSQERTKLVDSLAQQMDLAPMEVESRAIIFRAMISALSELSAQRNFNEMQINSFVQNCRNQVSRQIDQQLSNRLLLKYHGLEMEPLQKYSIFYQTPAGNWLSSTRTQAVHTALQQSADEFMNAIGSIQ